MYKPIKTYAAVLLSAAVLCQSNEIYPVSDQTNSITYIAKDVEERVVFNIKPDGGVRMAHYDVYGNVTTAYKTQ
ncbi:hypothetical protein GCM10008933_22520 [Paenibacillus motobuensis]|uniref:Uncharacterized protein n=1 Tax=Paenibacillus motobuensis TaxID=295324 RepID=A0ABN0YCJ6_9BACL